jgi:hypothetical protein
MFRLAQYLESVLPGPVQFLLFVAAILVVGMLLGFVGLVGSWDEPLNRLPLHRLLERNRLFASTST